MSENHGREPRSRCGTALYHPIVHNLQEHA